MLRDDLFPGEPPTQERDPRPRLYDLLYAPPPEWWWAEEAKAAKAI